MKLRTTTIFVASVVMSVLWGQKAHAAELYPSVSVSSVSVGSTLNVDVRLDSEGQVVNAVEVGLVYPTSMLEFEQVSTGGSFVTLWTEPPRIVQPGMIQMSGGRPDGSVVVNGIIATVTFRVQQSGIATLIVQPSLSGVYLHDGHGTPASLSSKSLIVPLLEMLKLVSQPYSPTHPDSNVWYHNPDFLIQWSVFPYVNVSYQISRDPLVEADEVPDENKGAASFPSLQDGIWYFSFREQYSSKQWSDILHFPIHIDTRPPEPFNVALVSDSQSPAQFFSFTATDATSGIAGYTVFVNRSTWWMPWQHRYEVLNTISPILAVPQVHTVTDVQVIARDLAGNEQGSQWNAPAKIHQQRLLTIVAIVAILMLCIILLIVTKKRRR
jgi:hypothetical protein